MLVLRLSFAIFTAAQLCAGAACSSDHATQQASAEDCEAMSDHMLELRFKTSGFTPDVALRHRENLRGIAPASIEWCTENVGAEQVACALRADNLQALEACLPRITSPSVNE